MSASHYNYLAIFSTARRVVHHRRWDGEQFLTTIRRTGAVELDPPGISIGIEGLYAGTNLDPSARRDGG